MVGRRFDAGAQGPPDKIRAMRSDREQPFARELPKVVSLSRVLGADWGFNFHGFKFRWQLMSHAAVKTHRKISRVQIA